MAEKFINTNDASNIVYVNNGSIMIEREGGGGGREKGGKGGV